LVEITADALTVQRNRRTILHDIHARFTPGQLVGVIGPNGAGKSTLVRALLGLQLPVSGEVRINGKPVASLSRQEIARQIAYLPQGQTLHWPLSVERLVSLGRLPHLGPLSRVTAADAAVIDRAMARTDVGSLRHRVATEISGGERARVLLARALAVEAPALVADEPLASLDPGHQIDLMELLRDEARSGALVITVLHDLTMAARYCDRLLLLDQGRLVADGAPMEILSAERLRAVYGISALVVEHDGLPMIVPLQRDPIR